MGREITLNLLHKGAKVIGLDINLEGLKKTQELAGEKGQNMKFMQLDITNREAVEKAATDAVNLFRVMNINFYGTLYMVKSFLPHLLTRPQAHIVNVASMGAFTPVPGQTFYGASKAAVRALTEGLMGELMDTNVEVSEVFPGAIATNIQAHSGIKNAPNIENASEEELKKHNTLPRDAAEILVRGMEAGKWKIIN